MITDGITDPLRWLSTLLKDAVSEGTDKVLNEAGLPGAWVSKAEAYRLYGRYQVDRWIAEGLFAPKGKQQFMTAKGISRQKLEAVAANSNRHTYLPVAER